MIQLAVLITEAIINALTAGVIVLHSTAWKRSPKGMALMPAHVVVISLALLCFVIVSANLVNVSEWTWELIVYFVGVGLTATALVIIGEFQRRRIIGRELHRIAAEKASSDE